MAMSMHSRRSFVLTGGSLSAAAAFSPPRSPIGGMQLSPAESSLRIGLAAIRAAPDVASGLAKIARVLADCRKRGVQIVCFPETYIPGLRERGVDLPPPDQEGLKRALASVSSGCRETGVAAIVGMEWKT